VVEERKSEEWSPEPSGDAATVAANATDSVFSDNVRVELKQGVSAQCAKP